MVTIQQYLKAIDVIRQYHVEVESLIKNKFKNKKKPKEFFEFCMQNKNLAPAIKEAIMLINYNPYGSTPIEEVQLEEFISYRNLGVKKYEAFEKLRNYYFKVIIPKNNPVKSKEVVRKTQLKFYHNWLIEEKERLSFAFKINPNSIAKVIAIVKRLIFSDEYEYIICNYINEDYDDFIVLENIKYSAWIMMEMVGKRSWEIFDLTRKIFLEQREKEREEAENDK